MENTYELKKGNDAEKKLRQIINKNYNSEGKVKHKLNYAVNKK